MTTINESDSDLEFEQTEEPEEEEALQAPRYEIFSYPADTTLKRLSRSVEERSALCAVIPTQIRLGSDSRE
jgi:hypothetical protein